jgi:site-specific DNA-methyltransferase (adenine-specific)
MSEALELIKAWRFNYKTIGFTWVKTTQAGKPSMGMGHYSRSNAEVVLLGTRGNPGVEVVDSQLCLLATVGSPKVVSHSVNQVIIAPRGEHSAKPPDVHSRAVELLGDVPRLEMFARAQVPGWVCWGHDVGVDVNDKLPRMGQLF